MQLAGRSCNAAFKSMSCKLCWVNPAHLNSAKNQRCKVRLYKLMDFYSFNLRSVAERVIAARLASSKSCFFLHKKRASRYFPFSDMWIYNIYIYTHDIYFFNERYLNQQNTTKSCWFFSCVSYFSFFLCIDLIREKRILLSQIGKMIKDIHPAF